MEWESDLCDMWNVPEVEYRGPIIREESTRSGQVRPEQQQQQHVCCHELFVYMVVAYLGSFIIVSTGF